MPRDATVNGDGFRMYRWEGGDTPLNRRYGAVEPADLLSVTSIRSLAGEPFQLVNWKIANVVNLATGVRKVVRIGPRGGVKEVYVKDGPFPGEFVTRMLDTDGVESKIDDARKYLRQSADEPRDVAAVRGSVVHKLIELRVGLDIADEDLIRQRFDRQWAEERRKVKPDVTDEDVHFVLNGLRQYEDMRATVPFVIVSQEPQVFNLTAGYGGSADAMIWFLGDFVGSGEGIRFQPLADVDVAAAQRDADAGRVDLEYVKDVGGVLAIGDWKTSKGVYTNHVIQTTAYMAGEFVASGGLIDERLSDMLNASMLGLVIQIRPDHWEVDVFDFRQDVLRAFLGSVAFARFLAMHKTPQSLFLHSYRGEAPGTEKSEVADDSE